jgi:TPR repeat protein
MKNKGCVLLFLLLNAAWAGPLEDAELAYQKGDYAKTFTIMQGLAEQRDADAQFNLATMYYKGEGVTKDLNAALYWYLQAAEQGNIQAQYNLGVMYRHSEMAKRDLISSYMWFVLAKRDSLFSGLDLTSIEKEMDSEQIRLAQQAAKKCQAQQFKRCGSV